MIKRYGPLNRSLFLIFVVLSLIDLYVFFPSFFHTERGDHTTYLIETADQASLPELIKFSFSYPRTRLLEAGDQMLFRPVFYSLLSLETWAFRYNFLLWQITNFLLHLTVVWQMLRICYLLRPSLLAGFFIAHFSVFYLSQETVIWHHMGGNLLFNIFLLQAFFYFIKYVLSHQQIMKYLWGMVAALSLACFTHEFGIFCCGILALALYGHRHFMFKEQGAATGVLNNPGLLFIPVGAYATLSFMDYYLRGLQLASAFVPWKGEVIGKGFLLIASVLGQAIVFPYHTVIMPQSRSTYIPFADVLGFSPDFWEGMWIFLKASFSDGLGVVNFLYVILALLTMLFLFGGILRNNIEQRRKELSSEDRQLWGNNILFLGTAGLFLAVYILIIINGRLLSGGEGLILTTLYYFYFVNLYLTLCGYIGFNILRYWIKDRYRALALLMTVLLSLSILLNGVKAHRFNSELASELGPLRDYIVSLDDFVKRHRQERQFSFTLYWSEVQYEVHFMQGSSLEKKMIKGDGVRLLFRKYYQQDKAEYYLFYTKGNGLRAFKDRASAVEFARQYYGGKPSPPAMLIIRNVS